MAWRVQTVARPAARRLKNELLRLAMRTMQSARSQIAVPNAASMSSCHTQCASPGRQSARGESHRCRLTKVPGIKSIQLSVPCDTDESRVVQERAICPVTKHTRPQTRHLERGSPIFNTG